MMSKQKLKLRTHYIPNIVYRMFNKFGNMQFSALRINISDFYKLYEINTDISRYFSKYTPLILRVRGIETFDFQITTTIYFIHY